MKRSKIILALLLAIGGSGCQPTNEKYTFDNFLLKIHHIHDPVRCIFIQHKYWPDIGDEFDFIDKTICRKCLKVLRDNSRYELLVYSPVTIKFKDEKNMIIEYPLERQKR